MASRSIYLKINPTTPKSTIKKVENFLWSKEIIPIKTVHTENCYSYFAYQDDWFLNLFEETAQIIGLIPKRYKWPDWKCHLVPKREISAFNWSSNTLYLNSPIFADPDENY